MGAEKLRTVLLLCPLCDAAPSWRNYPLPAVYCDCGIIVERDTIEAAAEHWNSRPGEKRARAIGGKPTPERATA